MHCWFQVSAAAAFWAAVKMLLTPSLAAYCLTGLPMNNWRYSGAQQRQFRSLYIHCTEARATTSALDAVGCAQIHIIPRKPQELTATWPSGNKPQNDGTLLLKNNRCGFKYPKHRPLSIRRMLEYQLALSSRRNRSKRPEKIARCTNACDDEYIASSSVLRYQTQLGHEERIGIAQCLRQMPCLGHKQQGPKQEEAGPRQEGENGNFIPTCLAVTTQTHAYNWAQELQSSGAGLEVVSHPLLTALNSNTSSP